MPEPRELEEPDFEQRTRQQGGEARERLAKDFRRAPRLPWDSVHEIIGHGMLPGQLWSVAASSGHGKTTFVMNLLDGLVADRQRVYMLPLEQPAHVVKIHWAALRANVEPHRALTNTMSADERERVLLEIAWQESVGVDTAYFSDLSFVGVSDLSDAAREAVQFGASLMVVDYVQRVQAQDYSGYRVVVQMLSELAKSYQIAILGTAQLHRGDGDPVRSFLPPVVDRIEGGKILEQESTVVLGLYRPLLSTFTREDAQAIRMGTAQVKNFFEAKTMGMAVLKSRITGRVGDIVKLGYEKGRILCPQTQSRAAYEARHEERFERHSQGDAFEAA